MRTIILSGILSATILGCGTPDSSPAAAAPVAQKAHALFGTSCTNLPDDLTQVQSALAAILIKAQSNFDTFGVTGRNVPAASIPLKDTQYAITQADGAVPVAVQAALPNGNAYAYGLHWSAAAIENQLIDAPLWLAVSFAWDNGPDAYAGLLLTEAARNATTILDTDALHCYADAYAPPS